jgi:pilus assembly protein Flp/PilA
VKKIDTFIREEEGATAVEYGLLTALIALVMAAGAVILGNGLNVLFGDMGTTVENLERPLIPAPSPTY